MLGLWGISGKDKKHTSVLALYVLYSLRQKPKSGYEMLAEIRKKTEGKWVPSKGTLYPILRNLQRQKLIEIYKTGKRSKNIFRLTSAGKKALFDIGKMRKEWMENFQRFRSLFMDVLGEERIELSALVFRIKDAAVTLSENGKKEEAIKMLEKCLADLEIRVRKAKRYLK